MNWHERAKAVIPSGAQTLSKTDRYLTKHFFTTMGLGCRIVTDEPTIHMNKEYVDYNMALGAVILGYQSHKHIDAPWGMTFSTPHPLEVTLAEKLVEIVPSAEMVKFFKNGSDATEIAVRLARAYTQKALVFYCNYHGFHDCFIGSTIPADGIRSICNYSFTDYEIVTKSYPNDTAAIVVEPNHPDVAEISRTAREKGVILIFDEVLTGFRYDVGGLQKLIGITPDITCLGKCMANGLPLSAVVGKRELMDQPEVFASSTFGGETLSIANSLHTIEKLQEHGKWLWTIGERWMKGAKKYGEITGLAPRCGFKFDSLRQQSIYQYELMKFGIFTNGINNFCLAHTEKDIDFYLSALETVFGVIDKDDGQRRLPYEEINPVFRR